MEHHTLGKAPNYTTACIVMFGVNLVWMLIFLYALYGLFGALVLGLILHRWINWLDMRKAARHTPNPARRD